MLSPIKIKNLSFGFKNKKLLFNDLSFSIPQGKFTLLTGPSGSGKSTLLKILVGLYQNYEGQIDNRPKKWSMIFQDPDKQFTLATPKQELIFILENLNYTPSEAKQKIKQVVKQMKIERLLNQPFVTMSGGEKQRVAFALALAMDVEFLVLDEPFASCDPASRRFLIQQLTTLKDKNVTVIISDHNFKNYQNLIDEVVWCEEGILKKISFDSLDFHPIQKINLKGSQNTDPLFELKDFALNINQKSLIKKQNLKIYPGVTLLTGVNGSGKSSLFKVLTKMMSYQGKVFYQGKEIEKIKNKIYFKNVAQIFQNATDQFFQVTVKEELEFSLAHCNNDLLKNLNVAELLELIGLSNCEEQIVYSLSGGQKKKLQVLVMLLANPSFLLLDEPFAGLDSKSQKDLLNLIKKYFLNSSNKGILLISHQLDYMDNFFNYHLAIKDKQLMYVTEED